MEQFQPTERTAVRRLPNRGAFDRPTVYGILDEAFLCHVAFNDDEGRPVTIPTAYGRSGDRIYLHGSAASRMLRSLSGGIPVCISVAIVDAMVLARSAFHHSMNYRSVVIFGEAKLVEEDADKNEALRIISEHLVPGRWADVRQPNAKELKATRVLSVDLVEVSAKIRTGGPLDDFADTSFPVWAGLIPLELKAGAPETHSQLQGAGTPPDYAVHYSRKRE